MATILMLFPWQPNNLFKKIRIITLYDRDLPSKYLGICMSGSCEIPLHHFLLFAVSLAQWSKFRKKQLFQNIFLYASIKCTFFNCALSKLYFFD